MTIEEFHLKYIEFQKEWHKNIKNKAVTYAIGTMSNIIPEDPNKPIISGTKPPVPKIFANAIAETITYEFIDEFQNDIELLTENFNDNLQFLPSLKAKKDFINDRLKVIQVEIIENEFYTLGIIQGYPESIFSEGIIQHQYRLIPIKSKNYILKLTLPPSNLKIRYYPYELLNDFSLLYTLNQLIIEFELLNIRYDELTTETSSEKNTGLIKNNLPQIPKINEYPLVFKDLKSYQFFLYCIRSNVTITKVLVSKYFEIFKEEDYIIECYSLESFFKFINETFNPNFSTPMTRIEAFTSSITREKKRFKNLKSNFFHELD